MPKKASKPRIDPAFRKVKNKLPFYYMDDLMKLLPGMDRKKIFYAMESRCKDLELKVKVLEAMTKLAQDTQKKKEHIKKICRQ